jgi:hypothetical protein
VEALVCQIDLGKGGETVAIRGAPREEKEVGISREMAIRAAFP